MNPSRRAFFLLSMLFLLTVASAGQDSKKETQLRTVRGVVSDKSDNPLPNSVVFLKNLRTNAVRSNFADTDGNYRFSGLDPNADYEIHAELEGAKSPVRSVTSLDGRKEIVINLKIDRKK
ncbi:MAG TPA: carboxypeptidase-like regulatory domain-containing protein [Candidatus Acidoferrum sp.]|nr:carboxypeptidase-like regulatory domain-containing protein [Candidatus Acidoferrum sp.]